jgi:hypothetical protein
MDLREEVVAFRRHYRETFDWILQAGGTRSVVLAMGDRFPLLLLAQVLVRPMKLRAAVTTEAEARASVGLHRPGLRGPERTGARRRSAARGADRLGQLHLARLVGRRRVGRRRVGLRLGPEPGRRTNRRRDGKAVE